MVVCFQGASVWISHHSPLILGQAGVPHAPASAASRCWALGITGASEPQRPHLHSGFSDSTSQEAAHEIRKQHSILGEGRLAHSVTPVSFQIVAIDPLTHVLTCIPPFPPLPVLVHLGPGVCFSVRIPRIRLAALL